MRVGKKYVIKDIKCNDEKKYLFYRFLSLDGSLFVFLLMFSTFLLWNDEHDDRSISPLLRLIMACWIYIQVVGAAYR